MQTKNVKSKLGKMLRMLFNADKNANWQVNNFLMFNSMSDASRVNDIAFNCVTLYAVLATEDSC